MWMRIAKIVSALASLATWLLVLPVAVEEGIETWGRWLDTPTAHQGVETMNILYQQFGPASMLLALATTVAWWFYWYPPRWFRQWREAKSTSITKRRVEAVDGVLTTDEVHRLREASEAMLAVANREYQLKQSEHLEACAMLEVVRTILEKHDIRHPEMPYDQMRVDNSFSAWVRAINIVLARAKDINSARRAVQESSSS